MRRTVLASALVAASVLAGAASADAATLAGQWTASITGTSTIQLNLSSHGAGYTGTYTYIYSYTMSKKVTTTKASQPLTADYKVQNKIPVLVLHLTSKKPIVSISCSYIKSQLQCVSPANGKVLVFIHTKA